MELTLLWAALTAVASTWIGLRLWPERLPDHPLDRLLAAGAAGLVLGRIIAMLYQGVNPVTHPGEFIIVRGGVSTVGAAAGFILFAIWNTRVQRGALDALAPATVLGVAGWHAGCIWRDACLGSPADLPWAWSLDGSAVTRHPVEIYAAIGLIAGAFVVSRLPWRLMLKAGAGLTVVAAIRLITEPLRPSIAGGPVAWYLVGMAVGLAAMMLGGRIVTAPGAAPDS